MLPSGASPRLWNPERSSLSGGEEHTRDLDPAAHFQHELDGGKANTTQKNQKEGKQQARENKSKKQTNWTMTVLEDTKEIQSI